jgi:hypothetical protein
MIFFVTAVMFPLVVLIVLQVIDCRGQHTSEMCSEIERIFFPMSIADEMGGACQTFCDFRLTDLLITVGLRRLASFASELLCLTADLDAQKEPRPLSYLVRSLSWKP